MAGFPFTTEQWPEAEREEGNAVKERIKSRFDRRTPTFDRSMLADTQAGLGRPQTTHRPVDRSEQPQHSATESLEIRSGGDTLTFSFPSPGPPAPKSATFQTSSLPSVTMGSPAIGVALGSPTHGRAWGRSFTSDHISNRMPKQPLIALPSTLRDDPEVDAPETQSRKKKSGWKTLSSLLRSKARKPPIPEPFYKVRPEKSTPATPRYVMRPLGVLETPETSPQPTPSPPLISSQHERTPSSARGMARIEARAEADRAALMPRVGRIMRRTSSMFLRDHASASPPAHARPPVRDSADIFDPLGVSERKDSPMLDTEGRIPCAIPRTPALDLDIPNADMERYSVMFEKLLEPRQSILERRQSKKLHRLKTGSEEDGPITMKEQNTVALAIDQGVNKPTVPQRSVTSPHLTRAPSLTIRVNGTTVLSSSPTEEPTTAIHRPGPMKRSCTAPAMSFSPAAPNFSRPRPSASTSSLVSGPHTAPSYGDHSLPPTPPSTTTSDSLTIIDRPTDPALPLPSDTTKSKQPPRDKLTSDRASPRAHASAEDDKEGLRRDRDLYVRVKSPEDLERQIVQVSVARQVSVSRARRQVQHAVESKQPLRPRVVELSKNRKSTLVMIESGDD